MSETILAIVAAPSALMAFAFVLVLMKWAPNPRTHQETRDEGDDEHACPSLPANHRNYKVIALFVFLYQRSLLGKYFNRNGSRCCFVPSCTEYAILAAKKYGLWRGLLVTGDRFRRCTPSYQGNYVDFPS